MAGAITARPGKTCGDGRRWALACAVAAAVGFCLFFSLGLSQPASAQFDPNGAPFVGVPQVPKVPTATSTVGENDPNAKMVVRAD